jgi:phosphoglycerate kinase
MAKITIRDLSLKGKRVLMRVDYNVPLQEKDGVQVITNDKRIKETVKTIKHLIEQGARTILCAHLGRPKGKRDPKQSLAPVVPALSALIGVPVKFVEDCIGPVAEKAAAELKDGEVALLENLRYYNEEEANDDAFSQKLAKLADVYVNDAFGAAHRAHSSTAGGQVRPGARHRFPDGARAEISRRGTRKPEEALRGYPRRREGFR